MTVFETLANARLTFAEALSTVEDVTVRARGPVKAPKQGDGWVTVGRVAPSDYLRSSVVLTAVVSLGSNETTAEELIDTWAVQLIDAATGSGIPTFDVSLEPITLVTDGGGTLYALTVTATTEVDL